jgi:hypothetical protein
MKKHNLQNKEIDQIGYSLLKVAKTSDEEIEKIVANPQLFDSIKARIRVEEELYAKSESNFGGWNWLKLSFINRQMAIISFAVLMVFFTFAALIVLEKLESTQIANETVRPNTQTQIAENETLLNDSKDNFEDNFVSDFSENEMNFKTKNLKSSKHLGKTNLVKQQRVLVKKSFKPDNLRKMKNLEKASPESSKKEIQKVFYSLTFAENSEIGSDNLQIVRTELSRSELFDLGVNLQFENEASTIKTELLVGMDGEARAIRIVKKY